MIIYIMFPAACSSTITASSVSETIIYLGIPDDDAHAKVVMSFFDLSSSCWRRCWRGTEEEAGTGEKARRRKVHCSDFGVKKKSTTISRSKTSSRSPEWPYCFV